MTTLVRTAIAAETTLSLAGVGVRLGGRRLVHDITTSAHQGELLAVIGPNGAGKSTLVRAIAGLIPSSGDVLIDGRPLAGTGVRQLARTIATVPQSTVVGFDFTVRDVVMMGRHPHLPRFGSERPDDRRIVDEAMRRVGVAHLADRSVARLSGGERQLVWLAKAVAQRPRLLLLDEPTSALDLGHQLAVLDLARALAREGLCVVLVLHDLDLAARYADRLLLMHDGRLLADGPADQVLTPALLAEAFGVRAAVRRDPDLGTLTVTALAAVTTASANE
ncbi:hypothetical protein GCM10009785_34150 [Brooklawnia cerclae]|uniref:Iron complex transport system ATP-binding protein n=1 Tax=Brooklawnia cerclae TaxID=349934 RepID=A0ABX0SAR5_9ACTN|nr:heme ABC transporter ATP-binding protein [Brooklawnia cerclae]NIH55419.1 iron complex transport system ATP-binding protein [Brooklawnia cerclae]